MKFRTVFCTLLLIPTLLWAGDVSVSEIESHRKESGYFIANSAPAGKKALLDNPAVMAFQQTQMGRILFTADGAYVGLISAEETGSSAKKTGETGNGLVVLKAGFHSTNKKAIAPRLAEPNNHVVNFLYGDPAKNRVGLETYQKLVYDNVWPGINLEFLGNAKKPAYQLVLEPGANPNTIVMETGAATIKPTADGGLNAQLGNATLSMRPASAYQIVNGKAVSRSVSYKALDHGRYGFSVNDVDPSLALVITPQLDWSTLFGAGGGSAGEWAADSAFDSQGNVVIAGNTHSADFPTTPGAYAQWTGGMDMFIAKLSSDLTTLISSTFIGGNSMDEAIALVVDSQDNIHVLGETLSTDYPTTEGAWSRTAFGNGDMCITKFNSDLSELLFSTYLGASGIDWPADMAVDAMGSIYVLGTTRSDDFPTTVGAHDTQQNGQTDMTLTKISPTGDNLEFSTFFGIDATDSAEVIALHPSGDILIAGNRVPEFNTDGGQTKPDTLGFTDFLMLARFSSNGTYLSEHTFGGTNSDVPFDMGADPAGNIYIYGQTGSNDFPVTAEAYDNTFEGFRDTFLMKLDPTGANVQYATYLGSAGTDSPERMWVHDDGSVSVIGLGTNDFPATPGAYKTTTTFPGVLFLTRMNPQGSDLVFSTFLDGSRTYGIDVNAAGDYVLAGSVQNTFMPTTPGALSDRYMGNGDAFVSIISADGSALNAATYIGGSGTDGVSCVAADDNGNIFIAGHTDAGGFPTTPGTFEPPEVDSNAAYITKFAPGGSELSYSTFFGGSSGDSINEIKIDSQGRAVVIGHTSSDDFPTTPGAFSNQAGGDLDMFVSKLNQAGDAFEFSTYLGGDEADSSTDLILTDADDILVAGYTGSTDFPTTPGAYVEDHPSGNDWAGVVVKLAADGGSLIFSTFVGGTNGANYILAIDVDDSNHPYIMGKTNADDFPVTPGSWQGEDANLFVTKLLPDGSDLVYSAMIGQLDSFFRDLVITDSGDAVFTGLTYDADYPTTPGAYESNHNTSGATFVTRLNADGSDLVWSTFMGGAGGDNPDSLALNHQGQVVLFGDTSSDDFPLTEDALDSTFAGGFEAFISIFSADGSALLYSTYLGGSDSDFTAGGVIDSEGGMVVAGGTQSADFQTTSGAWRESLYGESDIFVSRLMVCIAPIYQQNDYTLTLEAPSFQLFLSCGLAQTLLDWSVDPPIDMIIDGSTMTLAETPQTTTTVTLEVTDPMWGDLTYSSILLVAQNPGFEDYNNDGCNNIQDLWDLAGFWGDGFGGDPNNDGWIDIRDLLYVDASQVQDCP